MTDPHRSPHRPTYLHRPDIAKYARVRRPTVTMWGKRHPTFPRPEGRDRRGDYFRLDLVVAWLSDRPVPERERTEQEPHGITYGQRVAAAVASEQAAAAESVRTEAGTKLRHDLLSKLLGPLGFRLRAGTVSEPDYLAILMSLIFLRVRDNRAWRELLSGPAQSGDGPLADAGRRIDDTLRSHALAPGMGAVVERLSRSRPADVRELLNCCERLGPEAFSNLLDRYSVVADQGTGEYFTPRALAGLMADLATVGQPAPAVIHDPYVRGGELLHAALTRAEGSPRVCGAGPIAPTVRLAGMRLAIAGSPGDFRLGGVAPWNDGSQASEAAGIIVANPPFNAPSPHVTDSGPWEFGEPPAGKDNFAWLQYIVASLAPAGIATVLMPAQAAVSADRHESAIRTSLVESGAVRAIISLPGRMFPKTDLAAALWILTRPRRDPGPVLLMDAQRMGVSADKRVTLPEHAVTAIVECYRLRDDLPTGLRVPVGEHGSAMSAELDTIRSGGHLLRPADYLRQAEKVRAETILDGLFSAAGEYRRLRESTTPSAALDRTTLTFPPATPESVGAAGDGVRSLAEICDLQPGPSHELITNGEPGGEPTVPVVKRRHLQGHRVIGDEQDAIGDDAAARLARYRLEPGDILLVRTGAQTDPAIVRGGQGRMLMGNNLIRLRVRDSAQTDPDYLLAWLSSTRGKADILAATTGSVVPTLSKKALGDLRVTLQPIAEQRKIGAAIRAVDDQVADLRALADAADQTRSALLDALVTGVARLNGVSSSGTS